MKENPTPTPTLTLDKYYITKYNENGARHQLVMLTKKSQGIFNKNAEIWRVVTSII